MSRQTTGHATPVQDPVAPRKRGNKFVDLTGRTFGRLFVIRDSGVMQNARVMWECRCECGTVKNVRSSHLMNGATISCGCAVKDAGLKIRKNPELRRADDRIYRVYGAMIQRCSSSLVRNYRNYGGRGIAVCDRWKGPGGYERFIEDMGRPPSDAHTLDRIDNDGPYSPENCRWATRQEQSRNKRNNRKVFWQGRERLLVELAEEYGLPRKELHRRVVSRGWDLHKALTTRIGYQKRSNTP